MLKRKMVSIVSFCFVFMTATLSACGPLQGISVNSKVSCRSEENLFAIYYLEVNGEETLLQTMQDLQEKQELTFEESAGMVTSINGKANTLDYSGCWMLYTTDDEMSNTEWGTIEYNGETLGSAIVGANSLFVVEGETYVWSYQSF